jgi:hypothetical protein
MASRLLLIRRTILTSRSTSALALNRQNEKTPLEIGKADTYLCPALCLLSLWVAGFHICEDNREAIARTGQMLFRSSSTATQVRDLIDRSGHGVLSPKASQCHRRFQTPAPGHLD